MTKLLLAVTHNTVQRRALTMSNKDSDSWSQTSSQRDTIEHQDLAPEESASQCESSMSRAGRAARRAAAEVRCQAARQRAAKEFQMAVLRQKIAVLEADRRKCPQSRG